MKTYAGHVRALDGLSFRVPEATVFGLLGPNGAGKSTAVRILTTLARADGGIARVAGIDVTRHPDRVRRTIGVVAQRSAVEREATGRENLRLQGHVHGLRGRALEARVQELLERFGLADAADRLARGYSGGMERRVDIAMALVHRPRVLFLDEPTTGVDPEMRAAMWREIGRLAGVEGITVLLTTHYLEEADELASRLAIVDRGRVVAEGTPEALKSGLRGDAIVAELRTGAADGAGASSEPGAAPSSAIRAALARVPAIRDLSVRDSTVRARVDDGARAVPAVLGALEAEGVGVASVTVARPSLDDVYLRHAGRTFGAAEAEAAEVAR